MASLQKKQARKVWYARFQVGGRRYELSTGKTKKSEVEVELRRLIAEKKRSHSVDEMFAEIEKRLAELPDDEQDQKRHDLASGLLQGLEAKLSIAEAWGAWLKSPRKGNPSASTVSAYKGRWQRFIKWLKRRYPNAAYMHDVTSAIAEEYAAHLWAQELSPSTYNLHIRFPRSLFKALRAQAGLRVNVWDELPAMEGASNSRRELSAKELAKVIRRADGDLRYMFAIGLYTGMRLGDVVTLRWDAVDLGAGVIEHTPMKTRRKRKTVRLPIHPVLDAMLTELRPAAAAAGDYLFPQAATRYSTDRSSVSKTVQAHFEKCGIQLHAKGTGRKAHDQAMLEYAAARERGEEPAKPLYRRAVVEVGFHSLRHSFVSLCANNKVPQVAIMDLVGHGSPAMTRLYSHAGDEQKAKAIATLPDVLP